MVEREDRRDRAGDLVSDVSGSQVEEVSWMMESTRKMDRLGIEDVAISVKNSAKKSQNFKKKSQMMTQ